MYGHSQPMNLPNQIAAGEDDDIPGAGAESVDNHHRIHYETHGLEDGGAGEVGGVIEDVNSDTVFVPAGGGPVQRCEESSQLTLSFRGQVYVFDSVTPDKVRIFFCLLYFFFFFL